MTLDLYPTFIYGDLDLTAYPFMVPFDGIDFSTGDLVTSVLSSFIQDGDLEVSQRRGNMDLTIPLMVEGADLLELALAQALLAGEAQKPTNTLTIDPGDGFAPATVFETFQGDPAFSYSAPGEQNALRRWTLSMRALPYGRSVAEVVSVAVGPPPAVPVTPVEVVVDDCNSTAGWSSQTSTINADSSLVLTATPSRVRPIIRRSGSFDVSSTRLIVVDWSQAYIRADYMPRLIVVDSAGANSEPRLVATAGTPNGSTRSWFQLDDAFGPTVSLFEFIATGIVDGAYATGYLSFDRIARTNVLPIVDSNKQQVRSIEVAGSAATQGAALISSSTQGLGDVVFYTYSSSAGYTPSIQAYKTSSSPISPDSTLLTGSYVTLASPLEYEVPSTVLPDGYYVVLARMSTSASTYSSSVSWAATGRMGGSDVGQTLSGSTPISLKSGDGWTFVPICTLNLPSSGFRPGSIGKQALSFEDDASGSSDYRVDGMCLYNLTTGRLSIVRCGSGSPSSGGPSSRLWLENASIANRTPSVMRGSAENGSDAWYADANVVSLGLHEFRPPQVNLFLVTTGATDAEVTLTHFPRWLGHAAS